MPDKKPLLIVAVILLSAAVIIGAMFTIAELFDRRLELESNISELKTEKAQLEVLLDQALKTLHHERLLHFGTTSNDMEGRK
jgi:cell division protein ZapA (FtsZ GTPase activity inhibitor)